MPPSRRTAVDAWSNRDRFVVVDGALATELERHGADISSALWSATLLRDDPALIARVHRDYLDAGADVLITASYQATVEGFERAGIDPAEAEALIASSVTLAREVRDTFVTEQPDAFAKGRSRPLVAASIGPYGAALADGSEYRGDYGVDVATLVAFHRDRLQLLADAGPDLLACETVPSVVEAEALATLVDAEQERTGTPAWITFTARDAHRLSDGTPVREAAKLAADHAFVAIGINCTALEHIAPLVEAIAATTVVPVVVYPNSGETWDAGSRGWTGSSARGSWARWVREWRDAGASLIGGCCRTTPADVAEIASVRG
ncbi:homocysteine S-methyltransferase [Mumia sp. Pv 4-285]|uniref:homocysteine S-methyltransferase n=1 Tax=Mumia qirimensis TaxID=3234852 RepID=UPI00351D659C